MQNALHAQDIIHNKNVAPEDVHALEMRYRDLRLILIPKAEGDLALLKKQIAKAKEEKARLSPRSM
jgi:hypothetical protein